MGSCFITTKRIGERVCAKERKDKKDDDVEKTGKHWIAQSQAGRLLLHAPLYSTHTGNYSPIVLRFWMFVDIRLACAGTSASRAEKGVRGGGGGGGGRWRVDTDGSVLAGRVFGCFGGVRARLEQLDECLLASRKQLSELVAEQPDEPGERSQWRTLQECANVQGGVRESQRVSDCTGKRWRHRQVDFFSDTVAPSAGVVDTIFSSKLAQGLSEDVSLSF